MVMRVLERYYHKRQQEKARGAGKRKKNELSRESVPLSFNSQAGLRAFLLKLESKKVIEHHVT